MGGGGREAEEIGARRGRIKRGREIEGSKGKSWGRAMEWGGTRELDREDRDREEREEKIKR
jgi:hypothetical protein